jgi:hypothetical protein
MPVTFDGFADREKIVMMEAFKLLKRSSSAARQSLLGGDLTAYHKWFEESGRNAHLMKVASIVNEVDQAIGGRPITFAKLDRPEVNVNTKNLCAYVWMIRQGGQSFHVGSGMRILTVWKTHANMPLDYLAQTMYHELTHKVGSTTDVNYSEQTCLDFAKNAPQSAVQNAENYNLFLREFM